MTELLNQTLNRRELFKKSLAAIAGIAIAPKLLGSLAQAAGCSDVAADQAMLDDKTTKYKALKSLGYLTNWEDFDGQKKVFKTLKITDSNLLTEYTKIGEKYTLKNKDKSQRCDSCTLYREGKCTMAAGNCVAPGGWCKSYVKKNKA